MGTHLEGSKLSPTRCRPIVNRINKPPFRLKGTLVDKSSKVFQRQDDSLKNNKEVNSITIGIGGGIALILIGILITLIPLAKYYSRNNYCLELVTWKNLYDESKSKNNQANGLYDKRKEWDKKSNGLKCINFLGLSNGNISLYSRHSGKYTDEEMP
mgnify:FL=1